MSVTPALYWIPERIEELLTQHGIRNRNELAERLGETGIATGTVYRSFDNRWAGKATVTVLAALAYTFSVPIGSLVVEPGLRAKEAS